MSKGTVKFVIEDIAGPVPALKQGGDRYSDSGAVHNTGAKAVEAATRTSQPR